MNERIEKLATQCRIEEYNSVGDLVEFGFDHEKFAELIIRECAEVVAGDFDYNKNWCNEKILEHFNIK